MLRVKFPAVAESHPAGNSDCLAMDALHGCVAFHRGPLFGKSSHERLLAHEETEREYASSLLVVQRFDPLLKYWRAVVLLNTGGEQNSVGRGPCNTAGRINTTATKLQLSQRFIVVGSVDSLRSVGWGGAAAKKPLHELAWNINQVPTIAVQKFQGNTLRFQ